MLKVLHNIFILFMNFLVIKTKKIKRIKFVLSLQWSQYKFCDDYLHYHMTLMCHMNIVISRYYLCNFHCLYVKMSVCVFVCLCFSLVSVLLSAPVERFTVSCMLNYSRCFRFDIFFVDNFCYASWIF